MDQYIKSTHNLLEHVEYSNTLEKNKELYEAFRKRSAEFNIEIISIYSSWMSPYITNGKNGRSFLIWDEHFWNVYDYYIEILEKELTHTENERVLKRKALSLLQIINANLLDCHPSIAKSFAESYIRMGVQYGFYANGFQNPKYSDFSYKFSFYSRLYVFFHEITHVKYESDPRAKENSMRIIKQFFYRLWNPDPLYMTTVYPNVKPVAERLSFIIDHGETDAVEEFMCDLQACMMLMDIFVCESGATAENAEFTICVATSVNKYTGTVKRSVKGWNHLYELWHQSEGTLDFIHRNNCSQLERLYDDDMLRVSMLYLAFLWHCEKKFNILYFRYLTNHIFDEMCEYMFEWIYVQDIVYAERVNSTRYTADENLQKCHELLQWNA